MWFLVVLIICVFAGIIGIAEGSPGMGILLLLIGGVPLTYFLVKIAEAFNRSESPSTPKPEPTQPVSEPVSEEPAVAPKSMPQSKGKFCCYCGARLEDRDIYCVECGRKL